MYTYTNDICIISFSYKSNLYFDSQGNYLEFMYFNYKYNYNKLKYSIIKYKQLINGINLKKKKIYI